MENIKKELVDFSYGNNYKNLDTFLAELFGVFGFGGYELSKETLNQIKEEVERVIILREEGLLKEKLQMDSVYLTRIELHLQNLWYSIQDLQAEYNKNEKNIKYFLPSIMDSFSLYNMRREILMDLTNSFGLVGNILNNEELSDKEKLGHIEFVSKRINQNLSEGYKEQSLNIVQKSNRVE
ncbi:hypothetical protein ACTNDN_09305 [Niallia sp. HCP3S3_B10]|uniref:hypothetical protein n=1 Tax=Niallia sp. HCP3S3_B10 TaxID=3438944 RepID=UPI003F8B128A